MIAHPVKQTVAIVGLGYVGLPLAALASAKGWRVLGYDTDATKVAQLNSGQCPLNDQAVAQQLTQHPFQSSTDPSVIAQANIIVVAVPTPVTDQNEPDLTPLTSALHSILPHLADDQTLIIESTINPGVMDEVVRPLITDGTSATIHLAHCPERINPADSKWTVRNIPRVLGSYTQAGTTSAHAFYTSILDAPIKLMGSPTEAEAVKILENTFRDVNIAFINEMAKSFDALNIDITNVIAGAATKPFAFMPHYPGNGVGGHCISVDPYYMIARARQAGFDHKFLKLARQINDSMPAYTIELLDQALGQHKRTLKDTTIAVLGVAYKKDVADTRNSPALKTIELLHARGTTVNVFDPHVPQLSTLDSLSATLKQSEAIILACDHTKLVDALTPSTLADAGIKVVIDGKNALYAQAITGQSITYRGVGRAALTLPAPAVAQN